MILLTMIIFLVCVMVSVHISKEIKIVNSGSFDLSSDELVDNYDVNNIILTDNNNVNNIVLVDNDDANNTIVVPVNVNTPAAFQDSWGYTGDVWYKPKNENLTPYSPD